MNHKSHATFEAQWTRVPEGARTAMAEGFGATAYSLREWGLKPNNPYNANETASTTEHHRFSGWREGAQTAERYWQDWTQLPDREREVFERAADAHHEKLRKEPPPPPKTQAAAPEETRRTATGGERVKGYSPVTEDKVVRVNDMKQAEEVLLRYVDTLHQEFQNEVGDIAKEQAEFQTNGYKRLSVAEQKVKIAEFAQRMAAVQTAMRWLAIGKTDVEKGCMALYRSVFRPQRVSLPDDDEQAE